MRNFLYNLSLSFIDLIMPWITQFDSLCRCLLNFTGLLGKCFLFNLSMLPHNVYVCIGVGVRGWI